MSSPRKSLKSTRSKGLLDPISSKIFVPSQVSKKPRPPEGPRLSSRKMLRLLDSSSSFSTEDQSVRTHDQKNRDFTYFVDLNDFTIIRILAIKPTEVTYIIQKKTTNKTYLACSCKEFQDYFSNQISILIHIQHPTIIHFFGYCYNDFNNNNDNITFIMSSYPNETLLSILKDASIKKRLRGYDNTKRQIVLIGISRSMTLLHNRCVIHKNLNAENVFLNKDFQPKICGFGQPKTYSKFYMAPETYFKNAYTTKTDVYSFGILMYEVISGVEAYSRMDIDSRDLMDKIMNQSLRPEFNFKIKKELKMLIESCWSAYPNQRPSFEEIYNKLAFDDDGTGSYLLDDVNKNEIQRYIEKVSVDARNARISTDEEPNHVNTNADDKQESNHVITNAYDGQASDDISEKTNNGELVPDIIALKLENEKQDSDLISSYSNNENQKEVNHILTKAKEVAKEAKEEVVEEEAKEEVVEEEAVEEEAKEEVVEEEEAKEEVVEEEAKEEVVVEEEEEEEEEKFSINISNYKIFSRISGNNDYTIYVLEEKQTRKFFTGKIYSKEKEELSCEYIKEILLRKILLGLNHPSLLKYIGYSPFNLQSRPYLTIINEYAKNSLNYALDLNKLNGQSSWWTPTKVLINIFGIVSGMKYLHSHGYIHCNLSTGAILEDEYYYPKITNFENMENILECSSKLSKRRTYLTRYSAPEVIKIGNYSKCSDVYSFSYILYELITNKKPFVEFKSEAKIIKAVSKGFRPEIPSSVPNCYRDLIESCWSEDPDLRPSFHKINRMLKRKKDFILDDVNLIEYEKYIEKDSKYRNWELCNKFNENFGEIKYISIKYEKVEKMSKNKYANFYKVKEEGTGKIFQAAILRKEIEELNKDETDHLVLEVKILDKIKHKAIIELIGIYEIDFIKNNRPTILTEFAENGSLRLNSYKSDWSAAKKLINIYGIASVMNQLHKNNIINLNLKSECILLDQFLYPKLYDFQLCFDISDQKDDGKVNCMKKSDVYSFGLIVYEILTNKVPYEDDSTLTTNTHFDLLLGREIPLCFRILIEKCLKQVPFDRPSFDEIINTLKTPEFIAFLNDEDQKEEYFNYIYSIENDKEVGKIINIYKYQMISKICDKFNSTIFKIQEKSTKKYFAAKILPKEKEGLPDEYEKQMKLDKILLDLNHPSLLEYIGYSPFTHEYKPLLTIINEYAQCSLSDVLEKGDIIEGWSPTKKLINIYGIASGMSYLHSEGFIHRNLSTDNILEDESFYPKITGFNGIISVAKSNDDETFFGYPKYAAPEVIKSKDYSQASDVYAFSIILYELVTSKKPFADFKSDFHIQDAVCRGYRPEIPISMPGVYKILIELCWSEDPNVRPKFSQIVDYLETEEDFIFYNAERNEFFEYIKHINSQNVLKNREPNSNKIKIDDYKRLEKIGEGSFARIYKVKKEKTGDIYAAKVNIYENDELDEFQNRCFIREIKIMFLLKHPAIIKIFGYSPVNFNHKPRRTIIMEYVSNGCLANYIELERKGNSPPGWDSTQKHINIYGIALGMEYLHSLNIIHRDLKPRNILEDDYLFPKICDFGLSKLLHRNPDRMTLTYKNVFKGTPIYMAPEVIKKYVYSKASDVYAFGILLYEMFSKKEIFERMNILQLYSVVLDGKRPEFEPSFPENYKILIEKCWVQEPNSRPSFSDIVQILKTDEFLEGINKKTFSEYVEYCKYSNKKNYFTSLKKVKADLQIQKEVPVICPDVNRVDSSIFYREEKVGSGGFAKVYKIVNRSTNEVFAAKILKNQLEDLGEKDIINFNRELEIISKVQHETIIKFIGFSLHKQKPVIVTDFVPNGSLSSVLLKERKGLTIDGWNDTKKLINIYGVAAAMKYMHSKSFLHRDLKVENILLDEYLYPKLSDYGLSKVFSQKVCESNSGILGTPRCIAPEILKYNEYSKASDVYAFSLVVYEIMTNEISFVELGINANIWYKVAFENYRPKFKKPIPKCYQDLIEICWSEDPCKRPSFEEIIEIIKSKPEFITENIDLDELIQYSESIGENYLTEDQNIQRLHRCKEQDNRKPAKISKVDSQEKINEKTLTTFNRIVEKEMSNKSISNYFVDLKDYEIKNLIRRGEFSKVYEVIQKETGKKYSARLSNIDMTLFKEEEMKNISLEFNRISQLNHPAILHFIGFCPHSFKKEPKPVVITELLSNQTLGDVLQMDRSNVHVSGWNATKKLMNIYGIASAMKYLHSHEIIHRNLNPNNIIMYDSCQPKLSDFGLCTHMLMITSMMNQTSSMIQGSPVYSAPEILISNECTKASDVYAFAMIAYEIITKEKANIKSNNDSCIISRTMNTGARPEFRNPIPDCYRNLIESGWSENPEERPSFDQIVDALENVPEFITPEVDKQQYLDYIKMINSTI